MSTANPSDERAESTIEDCKAVGSGKFMHVQVNATDRNAVFTAVKEAADFMGGLTGVVASQGAFTPCMMDDMSHDIVQHELLEIALYGSMYLVQAAHPYLKENGGGSIILFGAAAMIDGNASYGAYNITKGAMVGM
jgi:NAD(P)-dependent dehydrogenase (short-subunit alcohol dehydrogenase family)